MHSQCVAVVVVGDSGVGGGVVGGGGGNVLKRLALMSCFFPLILLHC